MVSFCPVLVIVGTTTSRISILKIVQIFFEM